MIKTIIFISRLTFQEVEERKRKFSDEVDEKKDLKKKNVIVVEPHVRLNRGPYLFNEPKKYDFTSRLGKSFADNYIKLHLLQKCYSIYAHSN